MCGRINIKSRLTVLIKELQLTVAPDELPMWEPRYNVPPTTQIPVIRELDNQRTLTLMRWGLLPPWTKDIKKAPLLNNARAETVAEKPSFRTALKKRGCLVPADGFYELRAEGKDNWPYYFRRPDERPLAFAGLWDRWNDLESCTIITTGPNAVMEPIHDRMPVILAEKNFSKWLSPDESLDVSGLLVPCPAEDIECYPVDRVVNNVRNEGPQCIVPLNSV